jgi:hypothetical protein
MSYIKEEALGGIDASDVAAMIKMAPTLLSKGSQALKLAQRALKDPHLQEVLCEANRVALVLDRKNPGARCRRTGKVSKAQLQQGIGLKGALLPARAFIFHRRNPWVLPAAIGGTVGLVFLMGYFVGKVNK